MVPNQLWGSVTNALWPVLGRFSSVRANPPFSVGKSEILFYGYGQRMTHTLESSTFPPFWVLNPNLRSEYLNHSLEFYGG
jgi:hypothetical protein